MSEEIRNDFGDDLPQDAAPVDVPDLGTPVPDSGTPPEPDGIGYPPQVAGAVLDWVRAGESLPSGKTIGDAVDLVNAMANTARPVVLPKD